MYSRKLVRHGSSRSKMASVTLAGLHSISYAPVQVLPARVLSPCHAYLLRSTWKFPQQVQGHQHRPSQGNPGRHRYSLFLQPLSRNGTG